MSAMRNAQPDNDPVERLRQRAAAMTDTGAALKVADATDPLYKSLDESQEAPLRGSQSPDRLWARRVPWP